jgi:hypothetical protein
MSAVLFYNSSSGEGATARLDNAGNYTFVGAIEGFSKDWTHIQGAGTTRQAVDLIIAHGRPPVYKCGNEHLEGGPDAQDSFVVVSE